MKRWHQDLKLRANPSTHTHEQPPKSSKVQKYTACHWDYISTVERVEKNVTSDISGPRSQISQPIQSS